MPATWTISDTPVQAASEALVAALACGLAATLGGRVTFVVSGGRTPAVVVPALIAAGLDWDRIDLFAGDERVVPVDHPDSTEGLFRRLFIEAGVSVHYHGPDLTLEGSALLHDWQNRWEALRGPVAAAFLGLGSDGHTASLFPGRPESADPALIAALVPETAPHKHPRLTLGAAMLARARRIVLVAQGADKHARLAAAMAAGADPVALPVAWITRLDQTILFADGPAPTALQPETN